MPFWEFLIQREGDRGWKSIAKGNLQLLEGRYRIVANTHLINRDVQTRITHQTMGVEPPKRRSRTRNNITNAEGLMVVIPFSTLKPGIWQFVCSGGDTPQTSWHHILKLKVLPRVQSPPPPPPPPVFATTATPTDEITTPLEPTQRDNWSGELERLLARVMSEENSIAIAEDPVESVAEQPLQIQPIATDPGKLLVLEREEFTVMPGDRFTVYGTCNLRYFGEKILRKVTLDKLLICLRHPETAETVIAIESPLPNTEPNFAFSGELTVPQSVTTNFLLGEVNIYDRYNIQISSICFRVKLEALPRQRLEDLPLVDVILEDGNLPQKTARRLNISATPTSTGFPVDIPHVFGQEPPSPNPTPTYPTVPSSYRRESILGNNARDRAIGTSAAPPQQSEPSNRPSTSASGEPELLSGELLLDFSPPTLDRPLNSYDPDTLEVVVEDLAT
jgi:hypothetical protein